MRNAWNIQEKKSSQIWRSESPQAPSKPSDTYQRTQSIHDNNGILHKNQRRHSGSVFTQQWKKNQSLKYSAAMVIDTSNSDHHKACVKMPSESWRNNEKKETPRFANIGIVCMDQDDVNIANNSPVISNPSTTPKLGYQSHEPGFTTPTQKRTNGPIHNSRYKAKMCNNWIKLGSCPYFEKCQFAHGTHEMEKWANRRARSKSENRENSFPKNQTEDYIQRKRTDKDHKSHEDNVIKTTRTNSTLFNSWQTIPMPLESIQTQTFTPTQESALFFTDEVKNQQGELKCDALSVPSTLMQSKNNCSLVSPQNNQQEYRDRQEQKHPLSKDQGNQNVHSDGIPQNLNTQIGKTGIDSPWIPNHAETVLSSEIPMQAISPPRLSISFDDQYYSPFGTEELCLIDGSTSFLEQKFHIYAEHYREQPCYQGSSKNEPKILQNNHLYQQKSPFQYPTHTSIGTSPLNNVESIRPLLDNRTTNDCKLNYDLMFPSAK